MGFQPFPILGRVLRRGLGGSGRAGGGTVYLLKDEFNTPRAAGSVNGTPAEPTGQTRTVTDTNSKLSITGGVLSFATGGSAECNPGLWWSIMTRVAGLTMIAEYNVNGSSVQGINVGWYGAQSNSNGVIIRPVLGTSLGIREFPTAITVAPDLGFSVVTYKFAVVLRATGAWYFIKGGVYTNWTLLYIGATGSTSMFPGVTAGGTTTVGTADNARIPTALYIPQPLAYDTFTRANGALGSTETAGPDGQVLIPIAWGTPTGTWSITTNKAGASALAGGLAIATIAIPSKDNFIEAALTRAAGLVGVVGRYIDANNYIYAYHDGANAGIKQRLASVETDIIAATPTAFVASAVMRLMMEGNSCRLFYNNAAVGGAGAINAALNGAVDGLYTTDTGNTFDGVTSWARGTGGEYEVGLNPL